MEPGKTDDERAEKGSVSKDRTEETAIDEQTGKVFELEAEELWDIITATFSVLYLIFMLFFLCWALFDVYHGQNELLTRLFSEDTIYPDSPLSRLIAYAVIGGGLGGVVNGFRSFISWHAERKAFGWRFTWKYITLPPLGAVLAAMVYTVVHCGMGVLGGGFTPSDDYTTQALSAFAIGALSGYGSHKVFKWLDDQVNKLFSIAPAEITVPNLKGKTKKEAEIALKKNHLKRGKVTTEVSNDPDKINRVIEQKPAAGSISSKGESVDITIAVKAP